MAYHLKDDIILADTNHLGNEQLPQQYFLEWQFKYPGNAFAPNGILSGIYGMQGDSKTIKAAIVDLAQNPDLHYMDVSPHYAQFRKKVTDAHYHTVNGHLDLHSWKDCPENPENK